MAPVQEFKPEPTAEIDVELSDGESDDPRPTKALKNKPRRDCDEEPLSVNDYSCEPVDQGKTGAQQRLMGRKR